MQFTVDTYWPLLLLLAIPYFWWMQRKSMTDASPHHLRLLGIVRSSMVAALVLALMQPLIYRSGSWISVAYLLDVSQSVSPSAIESAIEWIRETNDSGKPSHSRFIPFAANATVVESLDQLKNVAVADNSAEGAIDRSATNIEDAVGKAIESFEPHYLKRLVLITDGNENSGQTVNLVSRLKQEGIRVYTLPSQPRTSRDVWLEAIVAPPEAPAGELFPVEAYIYSQIDTPAEVDFKYGEKMLESRKVQLVTGLNSVKFEASIQDESGPVTLEAEVKVAADPFLDNNKFRRSLVVQGRPKVLYVEGRFQSARYFYEALDQAGFAVSTVRPASVPTTIEQMDAFDAIVLSDVVRSDLTDRQMQAIATYVRDLGGGLILVGGENSYGENGYSKTAIEEILPITFEVKKQKPIAMIVVLDRSESMTGLKMELAKEATKAPVELLNDTDFFGVVAFNAKFYWAVPFQVATNKEEIKQLIGSINPVGETDIFPALEAAFKQLEKDPTEIKHVILLSDGKTFPDDFKSLVAKMSEAKITVSTVAVGTSVDQELLSNIASWGKGRTYYLVNPSRVPQIFVDETEMAKGKALREDPFIPLVKKNVDVFKGIDFDAVPALQGYVATRSKETAEVLLESARHDPILARWQYGLGKTAAFTSDLKNRWAVDWLRWAGYPKFWSQLVRQTMRQRDDSGFDFRVARDGNEADITIEAIRRDGEFRNKLDTQVRVVGPDQSVSDIPVRQVGPGSYEAKFPLTKKGSYLFRTVGTAGGGSSRVLAYSYSDEYHFFPPNIDMLQAISSGTKGRYQPQAQDIFAPDGETTRLPLQLWPYFAALALLLYLSDVFLRRVRLFE